MGAVGILFLLKASHGTALLLAYAALYALGEGSRSGQTTAIAGDIFHGERLGAVAGAVGAMFGLGAAAGPWIVGYLHDHTGAYDSGLYTVIAVTLVSVVAVLLVTYSAMRQSSRTDNISQ
jgi:MFS family permease